MEETFNKVPVFNRLSFYVIAHADDWQLFMYPNVYYDITQQNCKTIFITTTAGDGGSGKNYWKAREEGLISSIRFCIAPHCSLSESAGERRFNDHMVRFCSVNNTTSYFLRLPDGNVDGSGFSANNFQSLFKLRSGLIESINILDNSSIYDWSTFVSTLEAIINFEKQDIAQTSIHYLNPSPATNIHDHSDHIQTGHAIQNMKVINALHQLLYTGYHIADTNDDPPLTGLFWKAGMLAAYEKAVFDLTGYSTLRENWKLYFKWCCRISDPEIIMPLNE